MKISLITSTFNSAATVQATFDSVRSQCLEDFEYIVVDGGSKDSTLSIIEQNLDIIDHYVSERDYGIYDALNKGIMLATGDIVGFIHSDDLLASPQVLQRISDAFNGSDTDAVYADLLYVDRINSEKIIRHWKSQPYKQNLFFRGWMPAHPTFYLKKSLYLKNGLYDTSFRISADYELMLRMLFKHNIEATYVPEVLVKMRVGGESNLSLKNRWRANQEDARAWKKNGIRPYPWTRWIKPLSKVVQFFG